MSETVERNRHRVDMDLLYPLYICCWIDNLAGRARRRLRPKTGFQRSPRVDYIVSICSCRLLTQTRVLAQRDDDDQTMVYDGARVLNLNMAIL